MTTLIACLSTGKGTWGHVNRLIEDGKYEKVFLITNDYGKENFNKNDKTDLNSETRCKFYVAITRAKYSVGIVCDEDLKIDGIENFVNTKTESY